jgi:integrase
LRLLSPLEAERFEQQLLASGRSAKTVANVHAVLHRALFVAVRDGLVDRNVASLVSPPRAERPEMTTWTVGGAEAVPSGGRGASVVRGVRGVGDDGDAPR